MMIVSTFYKYVALSEVEAFRESHQEYCSMLGIKGKILVAEEGINGAISGTPEQVASYKKHLLSNPLFSDVTFKDTHSVSHPYRKMIVRVRSEIVTFGAKVDLRNTAERVSPATLKKWIDAGEAILVDARNNYESRIGRFKGAIAPDIDAFRDFPKAAGQLPKDSGKKIVTYCTGGIRCEKASAFLQEQGFPEVYQLQDGILNYIQQFPDDSFEGRCFVFDSRLSVPSGPGNREITTCELCHVPCGSYVNCRNVKCDKMFISCDSCSGEMSRTCSKKCRNLVENGHRA